MRYTVILEQEPDGGYVRAILSRRKREKNTSN
jgi:hypothetical protein